MCFRWELAYKSSKLRVTCHIYSQSTKLLKLAFPASKSATKPRNAGSAVSARLRGRRGGSAGRTGHVDREKLFFCFSGVSFVSIETASQLVLNGFKML